MMKLLPLLTAGIFIPSHVFSFAPTNMYERRVAELNMSNNSGMDVIKTKAASCAVAAGLVLSSVFNVGLSPAEAFDNSFDLGSSQIVAARSGGRAGGRSMGGGGRSMGARPSGGGGGGYRGASPSAARYYQRPMVSPIIVSPFGYSPFGYSPFGGLGMGYGLGSMNRAGDELRNENQDRQLADEQSELAVAKQKAADLEARIRALEGTQPGGPVISSPEVKK